MKGNLDIPRQWLPAEGEYAGARFDIRLSFSRDMQPITEGKTNVPGYGNTNVLRFGPFIDGDNVGHALLQVDWLPEWFSGRVYYAKYAEPGIVALDPATGARRWRAGLKWKGGQAVVTPDRIVYSTAYELAAAE